jgi:hypothetical protein
MTEYFRARNEVTLPAITGLVRLQNNGAVHIIRLHFISCLNEPGETDMFLPHGETVLHFPPNLRKADSTFSIRPLRHPENFPIRNPLIMRLQCFQPPTVEVVALVDIFSNSGDSHFNFQRIYENFSRP